MASERKWTKGPWKFKPHGSRFRIIEAEQETSIAIGQNQGDVESEANARLIASAPDLYEALESLLDPSTDMLAHAGNVRKARAALAKAKGE